MSLQNPLHEILSRMEATGGNFVKRLALLVLAADPENAEKLFSAFEDIFQKYDQHVTDRKAETNRNRTPRPCLDSCVCKDA